MNKPKIKVTISTITPRGVEPQFYGIFNHSILADDYSREYRKLAAGAGVMIRIDREAVPQRRSTDG